MNVVLLCWRDTGHPQGGGSERYLEHVARYLVRQGHNVVFRTAWYTGANRKETIEGVRFSRWGNRYTVYPLALWWLLRQRPDVVVDTCNGVPFFAKLATRAPVVVLNHHCHKEQWPVAGKVVGKIGWWLEHAVTPRLYRDNTWVTVSKPSAAELVALGVAPEQITIIRNGCDPLPAAEDTVTVASCNNPHVITVSRLVPHKQIEHAMDVVAALPKVELDVVGSGWWEQKLREYAHTLGIADRVHFHGQVSEQLKHALLERAQLHLMPSAKEGWGIAVMEAAQHGVPTVGYVSSAGLQDSVVDGQTGVLVDTPAQLQDAVATLLADAPLRRTLGQAAQERARRYSWADTGRQWLRLLRSVVQ